MRATTVLLALAVLLSFACGHSIGVPVGYAGQPPESRTCSACHRPTAGAPPLPNLGPGKLELLGLPERYEIGGPIVDCTVVLQDPGKVRWGFQLTAVGRDRRPGGNLLLPLLSDPGYNHVRLTSEATGTAPLSYLTHTLVGTQWSEDPLDLGGPVYWRFRWQPPPQYAVGEIVFYLTGVAATADGLATGDHGYALLRRVQAPPDLSADISGDGRINYLDYFLFALRWQSRP